MLLERGAGMAHSSVAELAIVQCGCNVVVVVDIGTARGGWHSGSEAVVGGGLLVIDVGWPLTVQWVERLVAARRR